MIPVPVAKRIILESVNILEPEEIDISLSLNRVLYGDIFSSEDIPPSNLSAMDGYALRSEDIKGLSEKVLNVVDDIPAGSFPKKKIEKDKAARIMTGAVLPEGADAVVKLEETEVFGNFVKVKRKIKQWENVIKRGESIKKGEQLLEDGRIIHPPEIGILASLGIRKIKVIRQPRIAILSTGNEIIDIDETLSEGKIRNINTWTLSSQIKESYAIPIDLGIGKDTKEDISTKIEKGLIEADMLITSGGVSVGDYDIVKEALESLGLIVKFHNVSMKPGRPTLFGIIKGKPFFGLPGYPVSSMVCFEVLVRPAILKAGGRKNLERPIIKAKLQEDIIRKKANRREYLRVILEKKNGDFYARLTGNQASSVLTSMLKADGLLMVEGEIDFIPSQSEVSVYLLRDVEH